MSSLVVRTGERVVETYNYFLNSDDAVNDGQNFNFQFGANAIKTHDKGQFIRLNLVNFNMYKNWTDVNPTNQGVVLVSNAGATITPITIQNQNYATLRDLAKAFGDAFVAVAPLVFGGWGATQNLSWTPDVGTGIAGTSDNVISFIVETTNPHGVAALLAADNGSFNIVCPIDPENYAGGAPAGIGSGGDSAMLLGADRKAAAPITNQSFNITVIDANKFKVSGSYPAQRNTEPNIYLRVNPLPQEFASEGFNGPLTTSPQDQINTSNIFAEIKVDTEMVQYEPTAPKIFFVNLYQKIMGNLHIRLSDSRNRDLPTFPSTLGTQQTTGNRHFTITIRVEIVEGSAPNEPQVPMGHVHHSLPARFDSNLLINQKNGQPGYNTPLGY